MGVTRDHLVAADCTVNNVALRPSVQMKEWVRLQMVMSKTRISAAVGVLCCVRLYGRVLDDVVTNGRVDA